MMRARAHARGCRRLLTEHVPQVGIRDASSVLLKAGSHASVDMVTDSVQEAVGSELFITVLRRRDSAAPAVALRAPAEGGLLVAAVPAATRPSGGALLMDDVVDVDDNDDDVDAIGAWLDRTTAIDEPRDEAALAVSRAAVMESSESSNGSVAHAAAAADASGGAGIEGGGGAGTAAAGDGGAADVVCVVDPDVVDAGSVDGDDAAGVVFDRVEGGGGGSGGGDDDDVVLEKIEASRNMHRLSWLKPLIAEYKSGAVSVAAAPASLCD